MIPVERIKELQGEYDILSAKVVDSSLMSDKKEFRKISKRFNEVAGIMRCYAELEKLEKLLAECEEMMAFESDKEMLEMTQEEAEILKGQIEKKTEDLKALLLPNDPNDDKDAIVEIRAGTGGDEAALFVADLYRMYTYYAQRKNWKLSEISSSPTGIGGLKEIIFSLHGDAVFGHMRFESGVHRVQRVPNTEASGRIHTSAISVAVLPEADEVDIEISDNDLRVDVYRSSGNGGQSVNTTDSAVRITHIPSGVVVTCQDEKSQIKNKAKAMKHLRARLLDMEISKQEAEISSARKLQVGTGDRSAKIRTYNFPQSRVTDHRINLTSYRLNGILVGELDEFIDQLKISYKNEKLNNG